MAILRKGTSALVELPDSPEYTFGETVTQIRRYAGPHTLCLSSAPLRGALGTGASSGYRVVESKVTHDRGNEGTLTVRYETNGQPPQGAQLPVNEQSLTLEKIEQPLAKHERYATLTSADMHVIDTLIETSIEDPAHLAAADYLADPLTDPKVLELYAKMAKKHTHYALYTPVFAITLYYWSVPTGIHGGGIRETPPGDVVTLPSGFDWLREGDQVNFNGTHWTLTKRWIAAPDLDTDIYPT